MSTELKLHELSFVVAAACALLGCSSAPDLVAQGRVRAEVVDSKRLDLASPSLREENGGLLVRGVVRSGVGSNLVIESAHVHVELLDTNCNVTQTGTARWSPRFRSSRPTAPGPRTASYSLRLPGPLPKNPTVRISLANDSHDGEKE